MAHGRAPRVAAEWFPLIYDGIWPWINHVNNDRRWLMGMSLFTGEWQCAINVTECGNVRKLRSDQYSSGEKTRLSFNDYVSLNATYLLLQLFHYVIYHAKNELQFNSSRKSCQRKIARWTILKDIYSWKQRVGIFHAAQHRLSIDGAKWKSRKTEGDRFAAYLPVPCPQPGWKA